MSDIVKFIIGGIGFSILAIWYTVCWLCKKNDKYEKLALILTLILAGTAILVFIGASVGVL